jgi:uncharacterized protein (TIGR02996 family)
MATDVDALFAQIAATPDDDAPYLVLADVLQQRGDPRGELIAVQHAKARATGAQLCDLWRRDVELVEANPQWLEPMREHAAKLVVGWRNGFVSAVRMRGALVGMWRSLCETPFVHHTLTELHVDTDGRRYQSIVAAIAAAHPRALRRLVLGAEYWDVTTGVAFDLAPLENLPVEELTCGARNATLGGAVPATLQRLELRAPELDLGELARIRRWPALRSLVLWVRAPAGLAKVVTPARFPALRVLGLIGTEATADVARTIAKLPIVAQLERVDLRGGTLDTAAPVAALARRVAVDVRLNALDRREAKVLRNAGPQRPDPDGPLAASDGPARLETIAIAEMHRAREDIRSKTAAAPRRKAYDRHVAADCSDPHRALLRRLALARALDDAQVGDALAETAAELDRALSPQLTATLCAEIARRIDETGAERALFAAEPWVWRALRLARWSGDEDDERRARGHLGTLRTRRGDHATAVPLLAAAGGKNAPREQRAWAVRQQANLASMRSDYAAAEPLYREALALYREDKDRHNEAIVLSELSVVHWWRHELDEAEAMLLHALELKTLVGASAGSTWYNLAAIRNGANRIDAARDAAEMARKLFAEAGHRGGEASALSMLGELAQRQHRYAEARVALERAVAIQRERGERRQLGVTLGNLARVAIEEERYAEARAICAESLELHRECENLFNEANQTLYLVDIALAEGDLAGARQACDDAERPFAKLAHHGGLGALQLRRGIADELAGAADTAAPHFDAAFAAAGRGNDHELAGWAELWRAVSAARRKRRDLAEAALDRARTKFAARGAASVAGEASMAMAAAVVGRWRAHDVDLPDAVDWDMRMLARMAPG